VYERESLVELYTDRGNRVPRTKTCLSGELKIKIPLLTAVGSNKGLSDKRPETIQEI
jgi:hypothetical protein